MGSNLVAAIVAMDEARVIGRDGGLPWHLPEDLAHFKKLTVGHIVVMGRRTWESLPDKVRPLPGRVNIVVSRDPAKLVLPSGVMAASSLEEALEQARSIAQPQQRIWLIGGAEIFRIGLAMCDQVHLTVVHGNFGGDTFLPEFEREFIRVSSDPGSGCTFEVYSRG